MDRTNKIILGDCIEEMKKLPDNSIDAIITDPPAGISFMNKEWDNDKGGRDNWIKWMEIVMKEVYRILKPGAHGFVWALPRTSHWTATGIENAGFEIRDIIIHIFGSGFPKSLNIGKQIDKINGKEREVIGIDKSKFRKSREVSKEEYLETYSFSFGSDNKKTMEITKPNLPEAKEWEGWGTALKPAVEHWILIRKPLSEKNVALNVLKWETGGINIDGSRIPCNPILDKSQDRTMIQKSDGFEKGWGMKPQGKVQVVDLEQGRFPANIIHDGSNEVLKLFPDVDENDLTPSAQ
ncbi:MAG: DNA methyltransferase, partial [Nanoarchaeota archaeon]